MLLRATLETRGPEDELTHLAFPSANHLECRTIEMVLRSGTSHVFKTALRKRRCIYRIEKPLDLVQRGGQGSVSSRGTMKTPAQSRNKERKR